MVIGCSGFGNCWTDWLQKSDKTGGQPINNHEIKHCAISNMLQNICQLVHSQEHYKLKENCKSSYHPSPILYTMSSQYILKTKFRKPFEHLAISQLHNHPNNPDMKHLSISKKIPGGSGADVDKVWWAGGGDSANWQNCIWQIVFVFAILDCFGRHVFVILLMWR